MIVGIRTSEKCISGMATSRRHSLPTQPISREENRSWEIK
jgi:hypothetical protein